MLPGIDPRLLEQELGAPGHPVRIIAASPLAASTRDAPWRIDAEAGGVTFSYLLRHGDGCSANEVKALRAMEAHPIPTPRVLVWDESGERFGTPVFVSEWIDGEPLLGPMKAGASWAIDLYLETVNALQSIRPEDLAPGNALNAGKSIDEVIDAAYHRFPERTQLHDAAHLHLTEHRPEPVTVAFSNGDLWPENLLVRDGTLTGVIDWQHAGWSDPIFEFLLVFFLVPELRGRGIEQRYCHSRGYDTRLLDWYHGVEFFDSLAWVLETGEPYEMHTAETLTRDLEHWLKTAGGSPAPHD